VALLVAAAHAKRSGASAPRNPNTGKSKKKRKKEGGGIRIKRIR
jgi:hypothetical protein